MKFSIVIRFESISMAMMNLDRISGSIASIHDRVTHQGQFVRVITREPTEFIQSFLEDGYDNSLTMEVKRD